ncbi:flagellar hook-associated protein 3 [Thermincola ferriacetica]|uniref:Flagellar hook-associated protein 3 n=1 Tax=Thermincola ferriacetica TaxID=281456 RepID=A0A0L6W3D9_9FIRM|nr:flagellar hook-associated protein FlgL [Thermincola ferriacetica]KNZ70097.1 flagellar hook-associated protein 3 [Thermincola ferriacetica]
MRVTQSMLVGNFLSNLNNNYRIMNKIQEQLSTGKKINRPSDDPVGVVSSLRLRVGLTETEKYLNNVEDARAWLDTTDIALGQVSDLLHRARELTINGANDALAQQSRDALAKEIHQLRDQMIQVANTTHDGRHIFGGFKTTTPPFTAAGAYTGDNGSITYEIGVNVSMQVNITGDRAFINAQDVFQLLANIEADLTAGNTASLSNVRVGELDNAIDNILSLRSEVGAKTNRLDLTKSRLDEANLNLSELLSKNEDINTAEVITQLKMQENTYRTALAAGARIIQPTLIDFLR